MSATERIRAMLDERGVEYRTHGMTDRTWFDVDGISWFVIERENGSLTVNAMLLTPEQAIEATLGRGECRDLAETPEYRDKTEFKCSECGYEYSAVGGFGCDCGDEPDFSYCPNCGRKVMA